MAEGELELTALLGEISRLSRQLEVDADEYKEAESTPSRDLE